MLNKIIEFSIRNKLIIGLFIIGLIGYGSYQIKKLPIDAVPDITDNQVQVITRAPTLAAQEVEQFITYPVERSLSNIQGIVEMRSFSRFGLSVGALFAVIGNKYIVDSTLPETTTFTLVDILHELTLLFILLITSATAYSLKLNKNGLTAKARRFDLVTAITILLLYILANWYFISGAISG